LIPPPLPTKKKEKEKLQQETRRITPFFSEYSFFLDKKEFAHLKIKMMIWSQS
jgi:hypothetical protein